jgi:single-strand DNA-binding protein
MSINVVALTGRLTKDVELRQTASGTSVCNFTVAVDSGYGDNKTTDFINCVAWKGTADFLAKYFSKGQMIALDGRLSTRTWEGEDGKKNFVTEVVAREVSFCGGKTEGQSNVVNTTSAPIDTSNMGILPGGFMTADESDLPF